MFNVPFLNSFADSGAESIQRRDLTWDVDEHGLRAGDVGTVVERHVVPGVAEEGSSVEFFGRRVTPSPSSRSRRTLFVCRRQPIGPRRALLAPNGGMRHHAGRLRVSSRLSQTAVWFQLANVWLINFLYAEYLDLTAFAVLRPVPHGQRAASEIYRQVLPAEPSVPTRPQTSADRTG